MGKRKTIEDIRREVESYGGELLTTKYRNNRQDLTLKCSDCGEEFTKMYVQIKHKKHSRCGDCSIKRRVERERKGFYLSLKEYVENETDCKLLSPEEDYENRKSDIRLTCPCGNDMVKKAYRIKINGFENRCDVCQRVDQVETYFENDPSRRSKYTIEGLTEWIHETTDLKVLPTDYVNADSDINLECEEGHKFKRGIYKLKYGATGCPICKVGFEKTTKGVKEYIETNSGCKLIDGQDYVNARQILTLECGCGREFTTTFTNFKHFSKRCSTCQGVRSEGEHLVKEALDKLSVNYDMEVSFKELKGLGGGLLRYDFGVYNSDGRLYGMIEYDGKQHYDITAKDKRTLDTYFRTKIHDARKDQYVYMNDYRLLRIDTRQKERGELEGAVKWFVEEVN